tara:strand:- start:361 stop:516 length:156 start_codon:yes stop_codon:yes gene_type:complete
VSYDQKIVDLKLEVKEKEEEMEYASEKKLAILEEEVYNTKQSIKELEKNYV